MSKRVLLAAVMHEANSFARRFAPLDHFRRQGVFLGDEIPARFGPTRTEMAGFLEAARAHGWRIETPIAVPTAPEGPVARDAYAFFRDRLAEGARRAMPLDGVLLALHGSMVAEGEDDGDGGLAQAVRDVVGPDVPISLTLDPHSNVSDRLAGAVNAISAYRTHPHTDHKETGLRAAETLRRTMDGEISPRVHLVRGFQMRGFDSCRTTLPDGPMPRALALARQIEAEDPDVIEVSIQSGFMLADVWQLGPSVAVTAQGDDPRFRRHGERMIRFAWAERENDTVPMLRVEEAMRQARAAPPGPGPVVIADFGDAPGGGAYGDATALLRLVLEDPIPGSVFASIFDPEAARQAHAAGIGARIRLALGGHTAPEHGGGPVEGEYEVLRLSDGAYVHEGPYTPGLRGNFGPSALLAHNGVRIIVSSFQRNILDQQQLKIFGIEPRETGLIALKCMDAFRAAFQPIARAVIACESGGVSSRTHGALPFHKVRRPIWPLDPPEAILAQAEFLR